MNKIKNGNVAGFRKVMNKIELLLEGLRFLGKYLGVRFQISTHP